MAHRPGETAKDPSLTGLFRGLVREALELARSHLRLAVLEIKHKAGRAAMYVAFLAIGVVLLFLCLLGVVASAIIVLAIFVPLWVSALAITLVLLLGGGILTLTALSKLRNMDWRPSESVEAFRESVQRLRAVKESAK
jgi:uncharacterized membrane protein YqjE